MVAVTNFNISARVITNDSPSRVMASSPALSSISERKVIQCIAASSSCSLMFEPSMENLKVSQLHVLVH